MNQRRWRQSLKWLLPLRTFSVLVLLIVTFASMAFSQAYRGTINGSVTDSTGAAVPGARVEVTAHNTQLTSVATTNSNGFYTLPFLLPNTYDVKVSATGFADEVQTGVVLNSTDFKQVNFTVKPAATTTVIHVTANEEQLQTSTATVSQVLSANEIHNAPTIDNNIYMQSTRTSGVYSNFVQNAEYTQWAAVGGGISGMTMEGVGGNQLITMNGIINTISEGGPGNYTGYVPPPNAVRELNVQTSVFDAEIGRTWGGVMNTVLKTGTEKFHGELSFMYGDKIFNGNFNQNRFYQNTPNPLTGKTTPRPPITWSEPSFVVTGPVPLRWLNHGNHKTYFLAAWTHQQYTAGAAVLASQTVPTDKERNGDFSELLGGKNPGLIYDPTTTVPTGAAGTYAGWCSPSCTPGQRESFQQEYNEGPGQNYIPTNRLNPVAVNLLKYWPKATIPGLRNNYIPSGDVASPSHIWMGVFSIEHQFNDSNHLTVAFLPYKWGAANANQQFPWVDGITGGPGYAQTFRKEWGGLIDYTRTISSSMVLDVRTGGFYHPFEIPRPGDNMNLSKLGFIGQTLTFPHPNFPAVAAVSGFDGAGITPLNSGASNYAYSSIWDTSAILSKSRGRHSMKFGADYTVNRTDPQSPTSQFANNGANALTFSPVFTATNPTAAGAGSGTAGGDGIATMLLGYPTGGTAAIVPTPAYEWIYWAGFVQDDWRITPNITLNLGLRWDYMSPVTERHNMLNAGFDFGSVNPMNQGTACSASTCTPPTAAVPQGFHGGLNFVNTPANPSRQPIYRQLVDRWQPRLGVAWRVFPNTVVRAGYGFFIPPNYASAFNTGYSANTGLVASNNGNFTPPTCTTAQGADAYGFCNLNNPYPNGYTLPTGNSLGLSTNVGQAISFVGRSWKAAHNTIWTASVQQQFPAQVMLEVTYHGNFINGLGISKNWNALDNCYYLYGSCLNAGNAAALSATVTNPMAGYLPAASGLNAAKIAQQNLYLPYPEFGAITESVAALANSESRVGKFWYNALYATLTKRISHGLELRASTTLSHSEQSNTLLNAGDPVTNGYKVDSINPNNFFSGSLIWDTPKLNVNRELNYIVNGWQWDHAVIWQNGQGIAWGANTVWPVPGVSPRTQHYSNAHKFNTCYYPILANVGQTYNGVVQTSPVWGAPTSCQFGEQPAWYQQPAQSLNQLNNTPIKGARFMTMPYYDMAIMKSVPIREGLNFSLRADFHNAFNMLLNGGAANMGLGSAFFGSQQTGINPITGGPFYQAYNDPRMIRFSTRLTF
jgi:hypothetical protein